MSGSMELQIEHVIERNASLPRNSCFLAFHIDHVVVLRSMFFGSQLYSFCSNNCWRIHCLYLH